MAEEFVIKRAERKQARLRLAFQGPSGSGKTATSLLIAKGIVEGLVTAGVLPHSHDPRIGVIDTERQSASLYSHLVPFDTIALGPPYTTQRYAAALRALEAAGYPVILIDSLSHEWAGAGGILSMADQFGDWKDATPVHDEFVDAMLRSPAHLIVTMRSRTQWVIEQKQNRQGREVASPRRIGLAPVQRPGMEYEFTTLLSLDTDLNKVTVLKDRTEMFGEINAVLPRLTPEDGTKLVKWLLAGAPLSAEDTIGATADQKALAITEAAERNFAKAPNLPDLARLYETAYKDLRLLNGSVAAPTLNAYLARIVAAKDARKVSFGAGQKTAGADGINPEATAVIEELLSTARVAPAAFKAAHGLAMISHLPRASWDAAMDWIVREAGSNGYEVRSAAYPEFQPPPAEPTLQEKAREVLDTVGARRAGGSMFDQQPPPPSGNPFADMEDDIPL